MEQTFYQMCCYMQSCLWPWQQVDVSTNLSVQGKPAHVSAAVTALKTSWHWHCQLHPVYTHPFGGMLTVGESGKMCLTRDVADTKR